jgi:glutamate---cysteine ligase / carboxylate-amine ligase
MAGAEHGPPSGLSEVFLRWISGASSADECAREQFTFGIEEEYFLHDTATNQAAVRTPDALFRDANAATDGRVEREFLQTQAEGVTRPHVHMDAARRELAFIRRVLADLADEHGLSLLASGTHPTAQWRLSQQTDKDRYDKAMDDLRMLGQRDMLCGMHVHVSVPDPRRRIEVMHRLLPYLPLFVALSTSSPFWTSRETGLKGYRLAAYDELPRTGMPELFRTNDEYDAYVNALVKAGVIKDASFIWWMIRPSPKYPTLELRAADCCTRIEDAIAIAALYRALVRHLYRNPAINDGVNVTSRALAVENKWRAQRYGIHGSFVTESGGSISIADFLEQILEMTAEDARALECDEAANCRRIVARGTSADAQLAAFHGHLPQGTDSGFDAVIAWIEQNTLAGTDPGAERQGFSSPV